MLYYVKTGDIDTSLHAENHKQAAIKTLGTSRDYGFCVIVSEEEIDVNLSKHVYFLTDHLLEEKSGMRLVY